MNLKKTALSVLFLISIFSGCMGSSKESALDSRLNEDAVQSYVEAFIEYTGPQEKWAGPKNFLIHLSARGGKQGEVIISHPSFKSEAEHHYLPISDARQQLARIQSALAAEDKPWNGCLSPVRARLIRSDGAVLTKVGCRGQEGWPHLASELSHEWIGLVFETAASSSNK